ncbi:MAG: T9SS type A sorting domain-containing protein, partial [Chitinophagaceae bacterium]|nr:T9SS type A sorting domain-containing protein [Chitinophagaceae bacterium]
TSVTLTGASTTSGATFAWTGPNSFTATGATATATAPGTYTVTATNPTTGCTATASTTVSQSITAPATPTTTTSPANATLTCSTNFITLSGSSTTTGVSYAWTGPNNFSIASSQANAFNPGTYTLTATNPVNGCTSTATVAVTQNIARPTLPPISPSSATLTCAHPSVTLTDSSSTTGVSYSWSGPNSYTASGTTAVVASQGSYTLTVTDPSNGCMSTTTATIGQNFAPPAGVTAINNGPLTCAITSVTLTGSSSTTGMTYSWAGPNGFTASGATATTSIAGTYTLTVTNPVNGCTSITNTVVAQNTSAPVNLSIASSTGATLLTCTNTSITLTASSTTSGVGFNWSGPNGASASGASISATNPGTYLVTATNSSNGCSSTASANVTQNITPPNNLLMTSNPTTAMLTCSTNSIAFNINSSVSGATYTWTGPGGFTFTGQTTNVNTPGTYTVTATDPTNGCSSTSSAIVTTDTTHPAAVATSSIPANSLLTCSNTQVTITGSSATTGVNYSWTGPNGFTATTASATVTTPGNYTVTVTNPNNGCATTVSAATVTQNTTVPAAVSATVSNKLTCSAASATLKGSSSTSGVTYAWTGPGQFSASTAITTATVGGPYTLTVTDPSNGCSFSTSITVQTDKNPPAGVTATSGGNLSCTAGSVTLTGNSTTSGVTYTWAGPNGFADPEKVVSVVDSGTYFLTVNNPANGCTAVASVVVTADFTQCSMVAPKAVSGHSVFLNDASIGSTAGGSGLIYKVYPNPVNTTALVNLTSPEKTHVSVEVYNSVGVREKILFDGTVEAGIPYQWTLDASRFASGVHYCIIRMNNKSYTSKLLITSGRP